jgi:hypothetical protein
VKDNSQLYLVPVKSVRDTPHALVRKLSVLLDNLPSADRLRRRETIAEIRWILNDPILQSLSQIDSSVMDVVNGANASVSKFEHPTSGRLQFILTISDGL